MPQPLPQPLTAAVMHETHARLRDRIVKTPTMEWVNGPRRTSLPDGTRVTVKLELFQHTGTFKARGALNAIDALDDEAKVRGVTAVSAGNHAIATAWAAQQAGVGATVVMLATANPLRVAECRRYGADVISAPTIAEAFATMQRYADDEGKTIIHPFDGPLVAAGTSGVGLELCDDEPDLDAVIVPVGGGGLLSGVAAAVKHKAPGCAVYGVEPVGADSMSRSLASGSPVTLDTVNTVADSLGAPFALPYSFDLAQRYVDDVAIVTDDEITAAMRVMFQEVKLAGEPATASSVAALLGPLRDELAGKHVGLVACGANIDIETFASLTTLAT